MKTCNKCSAEQPFKNFHKQKSRKDGLNPTCKTCRGKKRKADYWNNLEEAKEYANREDVKLRRLERDFKNKYNITLDDYDKMFEEQDGACFICITPSEERLHVDHNHDTGKVRGLLCSDCNRALGMFKDSPRILENATKYLKEKGHYGT